MLMQPRWVDPGVKSLDMPTPGKDVARRAVLPSRTPET
jgi:hypothetical protein